jgi:hydrogenase maturation protease
MIRVIGCGNLLLQDEGVGIHLIRRLETMKVPEGVELIDGSTGGFDLLPYFEDSEKVIIVDTVKSPDGKPGDIYRFTPDDFDTAATPKTSLHDITLKDMFELVKRTRGALPPVVLFGVEPLEIDWGMELTEDVAAALPRLGELVLKEIGHA